MNERQRLLRWVAVAGAVICVLLVAVAARSGPSHPIDTLSGAPDDGAGVPPQPTPTHLNAPPPKESGDSSLGWIITVVFAIVAVVVIVLLYRLLRGALRRRLPGVPSVERATVPVVAPGNTVALMDEAVETGLAAIERGPVTDAVIACWIGVEGAAREAGIELRAADTAQDFAERVLGNGAASADALLRLAALYREARFSSHPMGEDARDEARSCLQTIRADLRAGQATGQTPGGGDA